MIPLRNQRHEKFAQLVASGMPVADAHASAGFARNSGNARRLRGVEAIAKRVEALQVASAERVVRANTETAEKIAYSRADAMREADQALRLALETRNPAAAVAAITLRAKLCNLLIDRRLDWRFTSIKDLPDEIIELLLAESEEEVTNGGLRSTTASRLDVGSRDRLRQSLPAPPRRQSPP